jgi:STE24 endopeptidase
LHASPVALVDPVRQRRARTIADLHAVVFVAWALVPIAAFLYLWRSGNAARLRDALRRRFRTPILVRLAFGASLGALAMVAMLPFAFAWYRVDADVGLTRQPVASWFAGELGAIVLVALVAALSVAVVLELVDRTRLWYVAFIGLLYAAVLAVVAVEPVLFAPLAMHHRPAPAAIVALGERVAAALGAMPVPIEIATDARRSGFIPARTAGLGPFARIVLDNDALARQTRGERAFTLTRQYAHLVRHDVFGLALRGISLFIVAAALAILVSDRIGFRRDDDPLARLALVGTFLGIFALLLWPAYTAMERDAEAKADLLALTVTADPASAVRLWVRTANDNLVPLCGRRTTRWYFSERIPLGTRIATISHTPDPCPH